MLDFLCINLYYCSRRCCSKSLRFGPQCLPKKNGPNFLGASSATGGHIVGKTCRRVGFHFCSLNIFITIILLPIYYSKQNKKFLIGHINNNTRYIYLIWFLSKLFKNIGSAVVRVDPNKINKSSRILSEWRQIWQKGVKKEK